jgi:uncharacterized protein
VNRDADYWIDRLGLSPHPEGGHYRVTYTSDLIIDRNALPSRFQGDRVASTAIYFLLAGSDFSAFHRIAADELWHFYTGSTLIVHVIDPEGNGFGRRIPGGGEGRMLVWGQGERFDELRVGGLYRRPRV